MKRFGEWVINGSDKTDELKKGIIYNYIYQYYHCPFPVDSFCLGCVILRSQIAPSGVVVEIRSNSTVMNQLPERTTQAAVIAEIISVTQMILPILIYIGALFITVFMFYRLKLKEPLALLTKGASRIIENDLDFTIEAKSQDELGQLCIAFETMRRTLLNNNRELWQQTEERKRLNAAFSHDLRNPVTVLKGSAKLAKKVLWTELETQNRLSIIYLALKTIQAELSVI